MNNCRQIRYMQSQAGGGAAQRQRIAELEAEEKSLAAEYEKTEQGVYLCEVFVKTKVALLTEPDQQQVQVCELPAFPGADKRRRR